MIGRFLRHLLEPLTITTAPAPVLAGGHVDVTADAASITLPDVPSPSWRQANPTLGKTVGEEAIAAALATEIPSIDEPRPRLDYVDGWPAVDRGVCYHHLHFDYDGRRFGALIHEHQHSATLLPCPYVGRDGR